jgi:hypothetical protein
MQIPAPSTKQDRRRKRNIAIAIGHLEEIRKMGCATNTLIEIIETLKLLSLDAPAPTPDGATGSILEQVSPPSIQ